MLGVVFLATACPAVEEKEPDAPSEPSSSSPSSPSSEASQPSQPGQPSQPSSSEPMYFSNIWNGEATLTPARDGHSEFSAWEGWESFDLAQEMEEQDVFNCQLVWDTAGTPSDTECADCEFAFDLTVTPRTGEDYILDDGTCTDLFVDMNFSYGYNSSYGDSGALMYAATDSEDGFGPWIIDGYAPFEGYESTLTWDESTHTFTYKVGYLNYLYTY
jgi:hypothetical protein